MAGSYKGNPFVRACAHGDLAEVCRRLDAGEDINQLDTPPARTTPAPDLNDPAVLDELRRDIEDNSAEISREMRAQALSAIPQTHEMSGLAAALAAGQMAVVRELMKRKADPAIGRRKMFNKGLSSAIEIAVNYGCRDGVAFLTEECGVPLWTDEKRPASDLLFRALPRAEKIHSFGEDSDPAAVARARALDDATIANGLATFDYLLDHHKLSIDAVDHRGTTLVGAACRNSGLGFYDDNGRVLRHVLARGGDPNREMAVDRSGDMKIVFAPGAKDDIKNITGLDPADEHDEPTLAEQFGLINKGRRDQSARFETTPLIDACYDLKIDIATLLLEDPRTDPRQVDVNGNNAFTALREGQLDRITAKYQEKECRALRDAMIARVRALHGANLTPFTPKPR